MPFKLILFILTVSCFNIEAQSYPWKNYPVLYNDVQLSGIFPDSKTFADCNTLLDSSQVDSTYKAEKQKDGFKLIDFINTYFVSDSVVPPETKYDTSGTVYDFILSVMEELIKDQNPDDNTFIDLTYPYIVSNPCAKEIKYYDSYFLLLGLKAMGDEDLTTDMLNNIAGLIDSFGYVPYGNRSYYLNRSALPLFPLMLQMLEVHSSESQPVNYLTQLEKEYRYWMDGKEKLTPANNTSKRVVLMPNGTVLNRHWNNEKTPRPEAYKEDVYTFTKQEKNITYYKNIRAKQERQWLSCTEEKITREFDTVRVEEIIPVALNSMMYIMESELSQLFDDTGDSKTSKYYKKLAKERKKTMRKYLWNEETDFFADYYLRTKQTSSYLDQQSFFPLNADLAKKKEARKILEQFLSKSLDEKGIRYLNCESKKEMCCYPPELQYLAYEALNKFNYNNEAEKVKENWINYVNESIRSNTICTPENEVPIGLIFSVYLYLNPE